VDFDFTSEQVMLRNLAREVLSRESGTPAVRRMMDDETGFDESLWKQLADTGLLGAAIDEERGGQGLGSIEQALIHEEMGRAVYPGPYLATVTLAASAIAAAGDRSQMDAYLPDIVAGKLKATFAYAEDDVSISPGGVKLRARSQGGDYILSGTKRFVPFAHVADLILVVARTSDASEPGRGITIFALPRDAPGLMITPTPGIDQTSKIATLMFDGVRVGRDDVVGRIDDGWPAVEATLRRAAVAASAEMLGAARRCLELSVEYAKVREQFGQPIGTFQAIKHALADMLLEVENCHAATYYAAWALATDAPDADMAASVAKSYVSEAARKVCGQAIQVHGGIGFTWEYDLHLPFKRAKHLEALYGDADYHRDLILQGVLAPQAVPALA
jgi:alkylation response protein AidB-like acyl-CoA dehydrogenase